MFNKVGDFLQPKTNKNETRAERRENVPRLINLPKKCERDLEKDPALAEKLRQGATTIKEPIKIIYEKIFNTTVLILMLTGCAKHPILKHDESSGPTDYNAMGKILGCMFAPENAKKVRKKLQKHLMRIR